MVEIFGQFYNFYLQRTVQDAKRGLVKLGFYVAVDDFLAFNLNPNKIHLKRISSLLEILYRRHKLK